MTNVCLTYLVLLHCLAKWNARYIVQLNIETRQMQVGNDGLEIWLMRVCGEHYTRYTKSIAECWSQRPETKSKSRMDQAGRHCSSHLLLALSSLGMCKGYCWTYWTALTPVDTLSPLLTTHSVIHWFLALGPFWYCGVQIWWRCSRSSD